MPILQRFKFVIMLFVFIIVQSGIVFANDSDARKKSDPAGINHSETKSDYQSAAILLNKYVNRNESVYGMAAGKYENAGIVSDNYAKRYMKILTGKLTKNQEDIDKISKFEETVFEYDGFVVYEGTFQELHQIKRAMLVSSVWKSGAELYKKTRLSKKIKRIEKKISKYCIVEYSKTSSGNEAEFYMPGELDDEIMNEEKEYRMSLSSLFSPDEESLNMDFRVTVNTYFYKTNLISDYSFLKEETSFRFNSIAVNTFTGMDIGMSVIKKKQRNPVYLFKTGIVF